MRSLWRGTLVVGKVAIPATLHKAAEHDDVAFRALHRKCGTPVQQLRRCPTCETQIDGYEETARGFEFAQGQFVLVENDDLDAALGGRVVDLGRFVPLAEVPPYAIASTYWIAPGGDEFARMAYLILLAGLEKTRRGGLGRLTLYTKERVALVRPVELDGGKLLALQTLYRADELRDASEILAPLDGLPAPREMTRLMVQAIEQRAKPLRLRSLRRLFAPRVPEVLRAKVEGGATVSVPRPEVAAPRDLVGALRRSVRRGRRVSAA